MYPGVPHSEDFVRELLNLLVEQSWSVDGQPLNDQHIATQKNCGHIHFSTYMKQLNSSLARQQKTEVVCA